MIRVLTVVAMLAASGIAAEPAEEMTGSEPAAEAAPAPAVEAAPAPAVQQAAEPSPEPSQKEACPEQPGAKTGIGCAKALEELIAGYRKAADELEAWMEEGSARVRDVAVKESDLQERIKKNEAALTDLKLQGAKRGEIKEIEQTSKGLWKELGDVSKARSALCRDVARQTGEKARTLANDLRDKLARALSAMR